MRLVGVFLLLGLGTGLALWWTGRKSPVYFCDAARNPSSYQGQWFYRLHEGPDGWLFRDDDLEQTFSVSSQTLRALSRLNEALAARGTTLVMVAQPPRGTALPQGSLPGYNPDTVNSQYRRLREALEQHGILVTDLAAFVATTPDFFFRRDHHWTPAGAEASARAVADTMEASDVYGDVAAQRQPFKTQDVREEEQVGSYGEAIGHICGQNPPAETLTRTETEPAQPVSGSLFGDAPAPPITLAGTSNSARKDLNFAGFLEQASGLEVLNTSAVGGGPQAALETYLRSETFRASPPTFLIWEFSTLFDLPQDPTFYRQLLPSLGGACALPASIANITVALKTRTPLFADDPNDRARYLFMAFSDLSITRFDLELTYRDAPAETLTLRRSSRERNDGRYFLELAGQFKSATLSVPDGASGDVQARLCP